MKYGYTQEQLDKSIPLSAPLERWIEFYKFLLGTLGVDGYREAARPGKPYSGFFSMVEGIAEGALFDPSIPFVPLRPEDQGAA